MSKPNPAVCTALLLLAGACASAPDRGEMDPELEALKGRQRRDQAALAEKQEQFERVLLRLDTAMDSYVEAVSRDEYKRAQHLAEKLEKFLREEATRHFDHLVRTADQSEDPAMRARAVGALGFSGRREALDPLLNALNSDDDVVVNNAVFALGILQDLRTPPEAIARILENPSRPAEMRMNAAWALVQIQRVLLQPERVRPIWLRILSQPENTVEPWILVQAIRGQGLQRLLHGEADVLVGLDLGESRDERTVGFGVAHAAERDGRGAMPASRARSRSIAMSAAVISSGRPGRPKKIGASARKKSPGTMATIRPDSYPELTTLAV